MVRGQCHAEMDECANNAGENGLSRDDHRHDLLGNFRAGRGQIAECFWRSHGFAAGAEE